MENAIMSIIGYCFIYMAVYSFRKRDSTIKLLSLKNLIIMLLVIIGTYILKST